MKRLFLFIILSIGMILYGFNGTVTQLSLTVPKSYSSSQPCPQKTQTTSTSECKQSQGFALESFDLSALENLISVLMFLLYFGALCTGIKSIIYKPPKYSPLF